MYSLYYWFLDWSNSAGSIFSVNAILSMMKLITECASIRFHGFVTVTVHSVSFLMVFYKWTGIYVPINGFENFFLLWRTLSSNKLL